LNLIKSFISPKLNCEQPTRAPPQF